jgi:hypothetical protein
MLIHAISKPSDSESILETLGMEISTISLESRKIT